MCMQMTPHTNNGPAAFPHTLRESEAWTPLSWPSMLRSKIPYNSKFDWFKFDKKPLGTNQNISYI